MQKELPFSLEVPLNSYTYYGYNLGILLSRGYNVKGLLYNHFTTLVYGGRLDYLIFLEGFPGGGKVGKLFPSESIKDYTDDPIALFKGLLDKDKYIIIYLNHKMITNFSEQFDWFHEWLLFGYDENSFTAAGYVDEFDKGALIYKVVKISFEDFIQSLPLNRKNSKWTIKVPTDLSITPINLKKIKRDIFLYAYNLLPFIFNANIYRKYATVFRRKHSKGVGEFDLRPLKVLKEHKQLLLQMMIDLSPDGDAAREYKKIVTLANQILMIALKCNFAKHDQQKTIDSICNKLCKLREEEPKIMRLFYRELKRTRINHQ